MILWLLYLIFFMPILTVSALLYFRSNFSKNKPLVFGTAPECRVIIKAVQPPDTRRNLLTRREAIAWPNQTLQRAFGLRNAFTTSNEAEAKTFISEAHRLIMASAVNWYGLSNTLSSMTLDTKWALTDDNMSDGGKTQVKLALPAMVRALALRASLFVLLEMREGVVIENKNLVDLGDIIHRAWMDMKRGNENILGFRDNDILKARLSAVFTNHKANIDVLDPRSNPLNLLLPGFETTWRIVFSLFIVLHNYESYNHILLDFAQKPTSTQFSLGLGEERISAEYLVKEALRLYPPMRRIRRAWKFGDSSPYETSVVDVEACQLDKKIWGADALQFNPTRWRRASTPQRSFLAFGSRPFLCPASHDFAAMLIGLLVGILLGVFGGGDGVKWVLGSDDAADVEEIHSGKRLRNERSAYEGVFLELAA